MRKSVPHIIMKTKSNKKDSEIIDNPSPAPTETKDKSIRVPQRDKLKYTLNLKPFPWTENQQKAIDIMLDKNTKVCFISGPCGSSKTLLAAYCALKSLSDHKTSSIVYSRTLVECSRSAGFLKGDLAEKNYLYTLPFRDKLSELLTKPQIDMLEKDQRIEYMPLGFMRGKQYSNCTQILDESQDANLLEIVTFLTRQARHGKAYILADPRQNDIGSKSGFTKIASLFDDQASRDQGIFYIKFGKEDIMRAELLRFIVDRLDTGLGMSF